jgi:hypothetical protein
MIVQKFNFKHQPLELYLGNHRYTHLIGEPHVYIPNRGTRYMYTYLSGEQYKLLPNALYICQFVNLTVPPIIRINHM